MYWLEDKRTPLVFLMGAAGCGKTALAIVAALKGLISGEYDSILLTRLNVESGQPIGFLKGTEKEKNAPWIDVLMKEVEAWVGRAKAKELMDSGKLDYKFIQFLRGHTFRRMYVIVDEA